MSLKDNKKKKVFLENKKKFFNKKNKKQKKKKMLNKTMNRLKRKSEVAGLPSLKYSAAKVSSVMKNTEGTTTPNASQVNIYAILISIGKTRTVSSKKSGSNWTMTKAHHTIFIPNFDNVCTRKDIVSKEDDALIFHGEWHKDSLESIKRSDTPDRMPSPDNEVVLRTGFNTIEMRCGSGKKGDVIQILDVCLRVTLNPVGSEYGPESAWFDARCYITLPPTIPKDRFDMILSTDMLTSYMPPYIPKPENYKRNYKDHSREMYALTIGPDSVLFREETGEIFKCELIPDQLHYSVMRTPHKMWKVSKGVGASGEENSKVPVHCLEIAALGYQKFLDDNNRMRSNLFAIKTIIWPDGYVEVINGKDSATTIYLDSELAMFGIVSPMMWFHLMPRFFTQMNVIYIVSPDDKGTVKYIGKMTSPTAEMVYQSSGKKNDHGEDDGAYDRFDRLGVFANEGTSSIADAFNMFDASQKEEEDEEGGGGDDEQQSFIEGEGEALKPDFYRVFNVQRIEFNASEFWRFRGLRLPKVIAAYIVARTKHPAKLVEPNPEYAEKRPAEIATDAINKQRELATRIAGATDCVCVSCHFKDWDRLTSEDPRNSVDHFVAVVPWKNYTQEYSDFIKDMAPDMQSFLFLKLYDMENALVKRVGNPPPEHFKNVVNSAVELLELVNQEGFEEAWETSGARFIFENENGPYAYDGKANFGEGMREPGEGGQNITPAVFAIWTQDEKAAQLSKSTVEYLMGIHENQKQFTKGTDSGEDEEDKTVPPTPPPSAPPTPSNAPIELLDDPVEDDSTSSSEE
jgi:hypothetical protein